MISKRLVGFFSVFFGIAAVHAAPYPTAGGEGGRVIEVTNLEDSGPGSFREALEAKGPRIIRFAVGGEIWPKTTLSVREPFVTIDGESAPSPGISLFGDTFKIRTHDVIMRHVRVRVGALPGGTKPENRDGISMAMDADGKNPVYNVLIENCSVAWAIDEDMEMWGAGIHDVVVRRCIIAECLRDSLHPKGSHSMGLLVGKGVGRVTIQENLFAHNAHRNPVVSGGGSALIVNNLVYAPQYMGFHVYPDTQYGPTLATVVGNVLIAAPGTDPEKKIRSFEHGINPGSKVYKADNLGIGAHIFPDDETCGRKAEDPGFGAPAPYVAEPPVPLGDIAPIPSSEVEAVVLENVGACPKWRDETDARIINEVRTRTGTMRDVAVDPRLATVPKSD